MAFGVLEIDAALDKFADLGFQHARRQQSTLARSDCVS